MEDPTDKNLVRGQAVGSAGELIVQARLLIRGWIVGNINSGGMMNAPSIDLLAAKGERTIRIAVKATGHRSDGVQWSAAYGWESLFKGDVYPDLVVFVWFHQPDFPDECRIFVVPAAVVDRDVYQAHMHWHSNPKRDGSQRKRTGHVGIKWLGADTAGNISSGFAAKWAEYEGNWAQLEP